MSILDQAIALGAVSYAKAYNFDSPWQSRPSSIYFFNEEGKEIGYYIPALCPTVKTLTKIYRDNPIDYPNAKPIKNYHY